MHFPKLVLNFTTNGIREIDKLGLPEFLAELKTIAIGYQNSTNTPVWTTASAWKHIRQKITVRFLKEDLS